METHVSKIETWGTRLSEPQQDTLADALKSLKQGVSRRLIGDAEHFWQKRYYDFNIRNYPQFVEKLRYIHRNRGPQQARLWLAGVESRKARVMRALRALAVEQFLPLRHRL